MFSSVGIVFTVLYVSSAIADVSHIINNQEGHLLEEPSTHPPPARPYIFSYSAGRAPGHIDRSHTEVSDGSGTIRGQFAYIDPRNELRTVKYIADEYGFHPELSHAPEATNAVKIATAKHFELYNRIAEAHSNPDLNIVAGVAPRDSVSVANAKARHLNLFDKIAAEHAQIGAEQQAQRLAFEATSEANYLIDDEQ